MDKMNTSQNSNKISNLSLHMANESAFLAWVRTSLALMAFGFVIERFSLFLKQFSSFMQKAAGLPPLATPATQSYSALFGIIMIAVGTLICMLSFINYKKINKQIDNNIYEPSMLLIFILTLFILLIGISLVLSLIRFV